MIFMELKCGGAIMDQKKNREIIKNAGFKILLNEIDIGGDERHQVIIAQKI